MNRGVTNQWRQDTDFDANLGRRLGDALLEMLKTLEQLAEEASSENVFFLNLHFCCSFGSSFRSARAFANVSHPVCCRLLRTGI